jgi:cytochrome oxidase Cu insertion factor (SCO1/SenC/PrrC family)
MTLRHRIIRTCLLATIGLLMGAGIALYQVQKGTTETQDSVAFFAPNISSDFDLLNHLGQPVKSSDFLGKKYLLVYFGFAYCPAICPTELQKMSEAYKALPEAWQSRIQPIFISVDPERDTPEILKNYVGLFMPELIGLTGTQSQIDDAKKAYKVYATKVPEGDGYTIDHSSFIYFIDLNGKAVGMFKMSDSADKITDYILKYDGLD